MVLDGQRMGDERDWVLVGFFVTCSSSAEKRFIRPAKQDEMGLCTDRSLTAAEEIGNHRRRQQGEDDRYHCMAIVEKLPTLCILLTRQCLYHTSRSLLFGVAVEGEQPLLA